MSKKKNLIETTGESVPETAETTETTEQAEAEQAEQAGAAPADAEASTEPSPEQKAEGRKPEEDVIAATVAMAKAASESGDGALAIADKMSRDLLMRTISFQLPPEWITEETARRVEKIDTDALSLILSWLALNWWAGYEIGRNDTILALKIAASKGMGDPKQVATVEEQIKRERAEADAEAGAKSVASAAAADAAGAEGGA